MGVQTYSWVCQCVTVCDSVTRDELSTVTSNKVQFVLVSWNVKLFLGYAGTRAVAIHCIS